MNRRASLDAIMTHWRFMEQSLDAIAYHVAYLEDKHPTRFTLAVANGVKKLRPVLNELQYEICELIQNRNKPKRSAK